MDNKRDNLIVITLIVIVILVLCTIAIPYIVNHI